MLLFSTILELSADEKHKSTDCLFPFTVFLARLNLHDALTGGVRYASLSVRLSY